MRRRRLLGLPLAAIATLRCSSGGGEAVVKLATKGAVPGATPAATATPVDAPEVILSSDSVYQGGTLLLSLVGQLKDGSVTLFQRTTPLVQGARSIYAFIGVGTEDPAGDQPLRVDFTLEGGSRGTLNERLTVLRNEWTVDSVVIPPRLLPLLDPKATADENAALARVYSGMTNEKLWQTGWLPPTGGPITTRFGERRSYNGSPADGHHSGTDIGAPDGTPVSVTNSGRVVFTRQMQLRGNMVIVDHGGGLYSGYSHLASFAVGEGEALAQGDVVGYVGSTGLSTGAHLHWEMSAGGVLVDAMRFIDGTNGF